MTEKNELSYEEISQIHRKEKKAKRLIKLEPDFFSDLISHVEKLRKEYEMAHHEDPSSPTTLLLGDEFRKVKSLARDIYDRRERKVILAALSRVTGGKPETSNMTHREIALFESLRILLEEKRNDTFKRHRAPKKQEREGPTVIVDHGEEETERDEEWIEEEIAPIPIDEPSTNGSEMDDLPPEPEIEDQTIRVDSMMVRILEDLDSFVASDMNTYDLRKEDVITLPKDTAMLLCTRGKAKAIPSGGK